MGQRKKSLGKTRKCFEMNENYRNTARPRRGSLFGTYQEIHSLAFR